MEPEYARLARELRELSYSFMDQSDAGKMRLINNTIDYINSTARRIEQFEAAEAEKAARAALCEADVAWMAENLAGAAVLLEKIGYAGRRNSLLAVRDHLLKTAAAPPARVEPEVKREPTIEECVAAMNRNKHMGVTWEATASWIVDMEHRLVINERSVRDIGGFYIAREAEGGRA